MASWESWFRTRSVAEVRKSVSKLELQIQNESVQIHRSIGKRYTDTIALADSLASLKLLGESLDSHIEEFSNPPAIPNLSKHAETRPTQTAAATAALDKVERHLLALADRSIVQKKYAIAGRSLYFYEAILSTTDRSDLSSPNARDFNQISLRLSRILKSWMISGSFISQNMFDACLIHLKASPSKFLQTILDLQLDHLAGLLGLPQNSIVEAFKAVDTTLFIYNQAVVDWYHSRLSQRSILDMPEFSSLSSLPLLLEIANVTNVSEIHAYPAACYDTAELPKVETFLDKASEAIRQAAEKTFTNLQDPAKLVEIMAAVVSQAQSSLSSADSGISALLEACEGPFSQQLIGLVKNACGKDFNIKIWEHQTAALKAEVANLAKIVRATISLSPKFSSKLQSLDAEVSRMLSHDISDIYKKQRETLLALHSSESTFEATANLIIQIEQLDSAYSRLGGTQESVLTAIYEHLATALIAEYRSTNNSHKNNDNNDNNNTSTDSEPSENDGDSASHTPTRQYWGDTSIGTLFELNLLIDKVLPDHRWESSGLEAVRKVLHSELAIEPEIADESKTEQSIYKRSSILLQPLSM